MRVPLASARSRGADDGLHDSRAGTAIAHAIPSAAFCSNLIVALVLVVRPRLIEPKTFMGVLRLPPPCAPVVALPSVGPYTLGAQGSAHVSTNYP